MIFFLILAYIHFTTNKVIYIIQIIRNVTLKRAKRGKILFGRIFFNRFRANSAKMLSVVSFYDVQANKERFFSKSNP